MKNLVVNYSDKQIQIMEAAEELFAEKGFDGTSVRDIAEEAGVNLAMISYYFGSKEKLMESLFKYRGESIKLQLESMIDNKELSSLQKVYALIDNYIERIMNQQCFHKILSRIQMVELKGITTQLIHDLKRTNQELVKKLIQEGQKNGEFKKNIDVPLMMATLVGTASHLVTTQHYYRKLNNLESLSDEEFEKHIKKKLSAHLKSLFKATLTYE
ncbi:MAG TPA: TetR family transcriptional regulator [Chitinophagaceae bacterium]|jgi:AcrR family transcriptional regulator|nr:TetR family transcriptional regulator [Chitinophagaceae bacterium]